MRALDRILTSSMSYPANSNYRTVDSEKVNFLKNNVFQRYFNLDLRGPEVEVPIFCRREVQEILKRNKHIQYTGIEADIIEGYVTPLFISEEHRKRTSESMIKAMLDTPVSAGLCKIETTHDFIYYGGAGIIFNKDMEVLLLISVKYKMPEDAKLNIYLTDAIVYVSPKVFTSDGPVEKYIIKKVIPFFINTRPFIYSTGLNIVNTYNDSSDQQQRIPDIIISDVTDKFISKPDAPDLSRFSTEEVNSFLLESFEYSLIS